MNKDVEKLYGEAKKLGSTKMAELAAALAKDLEMRDLGNIIKRQGDSKEWVLRLNTFVRIADAFKKVRSQKITFTEVKIDESGKSIIGLWEDKMGFRKTEIRMEREDESNKSSNGFMFKRVDGKVASKWVVKANAHCGCSRFSTCEHIASLFIVARDRAEALAESIILKKGSNEGCDKKPKKRI